MFIKILILTCDQRLLGAFCDLIERNEITMLRRPRAIKRLAVNILEYDTGVVAVHHLLHVAHRQGKIRKRQQRNNQQNHDQRTADQQCFLPPCQLLEPAPFRPQPPLQATKWRVAISLGVLSIVPCHTVPLYHFHGPGTSLCPRHQPICNRRRQRIRCVVWLRYYLEREMQTHHFLHLFFVRLAVPRQRLFDL